MAKKAKRRPSSRPNESVKDKLEFCSAVVVSTAHITRKDAELLDACNGDGECSEIWAFKGKHGWFVYVDEGILEGGVIHGFSRAFKKLLAFARQHKVWWIRLDQDGPVYSELRQFSW